jgi:hypothetical protein
MSCGLRSPAITTRQRRSPDSPAAGAGLASGGSDPAVLVDLDVLVVPPASRPPMGGPAAAGSGYLLGRGALQVVFGFTPK